MVAAYRDRYQATESKPLGPIPETDVQKVDRSRSHTALRRVISKSNRHNPEIAAMQQTRDTIRM